ncbi:DMT family transporter [Salaquimonas pukyongi]|uniref:DMT family transporter n=1 Tax=Salaquimonas pukyongi TaxID=2712698 RepID=UPI00096B9B10|nr:DMT family transporter [Salaquimonas pukyongi]
MGVRTAIAGNTGVVAVLCAVGAAIAFSLNDVGIKFLSGDYALHEIVLGRSIVGLLFTLFFFVPFAGGWSALKTRRPLLHLGRGLAVVCANLIFFAGLATLPLADAVAVFFVSPLIITGLSVIMLGEKVGPRRWAAVFVGLAGVAVVMRPGTAAFTLPALFPLVAALFYALLHMMTRRLGRTDSAAAMAFYVQATFVVISILTGLAIGDGKFSGTGDPTLEFLVRPWIWPHPEDVMIILAIGLASAMGGFMIAAAYKLAEAATVAPFEYVAMPCSILWGVLVFGDWPDVIAWLGILMIIGSGIFVIFREHQTGQEIAAEQPMPRNR